MVRLSSSVIPRLLHTHISSTTVGIVTLTKSLFPESNSLRPVKQFPSNCATRSCIIVFTWAHHLSLETCHSNPRLSPSFLKIHFNILPSTPRSFKWFFPVGFLPKPTTPVNKHEFNTISNSAYSRHHDGCLDGCCVSLHPYCPPPLLLARQKRCFFPISMSSFPHICIQINR